MNYRKNNKSFNNPNFHTSLNNSTFPMKKFSRRNTVTQTSSNMQKEVTSPHVQKIKPIQSLQQNRECLHFNGLETLKRTALSQSPKRKQSDCSFLPFQKKSARDRKTLVVDLDETLVHSSFEGDISPDLLIPITIESETCNIYVSVRPGAYEFIEELSKYYEIVIFTASLAKYADPLIEKLDRKSLSSYRLFREHCTFMDGTYIKDMSKMGRNLKNIVLLDNSAVSYSFQQQNGIPITSWYDDYSDIELFKMIPILKNLSGFYDVRTEIKKFVVNNTFIWNKALQWLKENNLQESFLREIEELEASVNMNELLHLKEEEGESQFNKVNNTIVYESPQLLGDFENENEHPNENEGHYYHNTESGYEYTNQNLTKALKLVHTKNNSINDTKSRQININIINSNYNQIFLCTEDNNEVPQKEKISNASQTKMKLHYKKIKSQTSQNENIRIIHHEQNENENSFVHYEHLQTEIDQNSPSTLEKIITQSDSTQRLYTDQANEERNDHNTSKCFLTTVRKKNCFPNYKIHSANFLRFAKQIQLNKSITKKINLNDTNQGNSINSSIMKKRNIFSALPQTSKSLVFGKNILNDNKWKRELLQKISNYSIKKVEDRNILFDSPKKRKDLHLKSNFISKIFPKPNTTGAIIKLDEMRDFYKKKMSGTKTSMNSSFSLIKPQRDSNSYLRRNISRDQSSSKVFCDKMITTISKKTSDAMRISHLKLTHFKKGQSSSIKEKLQAAFHNQNCFKQSKPSCK